MFGDQICLFISILLELALRSGRMIRTSCRITRRYDLRQSSLSSRLPPALQLSNRKAQLALESVTRSTVLISEQAALTLAIVFGLTSAAARADGLAAGGDPATTAPLTDNRATTSITEPANTLKRTRSAEMTENSAGGRPRWLRTWLTMAVIV